MPLEEEPRFRILIVDDDQVDRRAVRRALGSRYAVTEAEDGKQALRCLDEMSHNCVLLDYHIPGTDTLGLLDKLRHRAPVVMLTGQGDEGVAVALMKAGAQDYLSKNDFSAETLDVAIKRSIEKSDRQRKHVESRKRLQDEFRQEKQRRLDLEASLQVARDIQQHLLPSSAPDFPGFSVCGVCLPTDATGGDFFDYVTMADGSIGLVIVDVSGHGIGPALLAAEARACIRALCRTISDVGQIATVVNKLLTEDMPGGRFVTLFMGKLNAAERTLSFAAAGQSAYIIHETGDFTSLESQAPPLGLFEHTVVPASQLLPLKSGDILLLATDGLFEAHGPNRTMFGKERCIQLVHSRRSSPCQKILDELLDAMRRFAGNVPPHDDVTIVIGKLK